MITTISTSVFAEVRLCRRTTAKRSAKELLSTVGAEVEPHLLIDVVADLIVLGVIQSFENVLDFLEMILIAIKTVFHRIERGINFHFNDVPKIIFRIKRTTTAVTRVMNHRTEFPEFPIVEFPTS